MASAHLSRAFSSSSTNTKATWSYWLKLSDVISNNENFIFASRDAANNNLRTYFRVSNDRTFAVLMYDGSGNQLVNKQTTRKFRDPSAWYHVVYRVDTTQGSADDRVRLYVNGEQETSFTTNTQPAQNSAIRTVSSVNTVWGVNHTPSGGAYLNGMLTHINFVEGTSYGPTSFGETDTSTGIWKPKTAPSVTYGANGYFLKMDNSANMGLDSANSNNFTTNGTIIQTKDTPSNVYCTMNPLDNYYPASTFTHVNNTILTANSNRSYNTGTLGVSSGKWYWEIKNISNVTSGNGTYIGIASTNPTNDGVSSAAVLGNKQYDYAYLSATGEYRTNSSNSSYGNTYGDNDIIGIAMDLDNNKLYFSKNGTWQNSGVPTSGSTGTGAISIQAPSGTVNGVYTPGLGDWWVNGFTVSFNFGNGYFGTTAVSSAGSNGNGSVFEYDVPTGYYALNTKNIGTQS